MLVINAEEIEEEDKILCQIATETWRLEVLELEVVAFSATQFFWLMLESKIQTVKSHPEWMAEATTRNKDVGNSWCRRGTR